MHHGFRRLVFAALDQAQQRTTLQSLVALTGIGDDQARLDGTLIRGLPENQRLNMAVNGRSDASLTVEMRNLNLPDPLPAGWQVEPINRQRSRVSFPADTELRAPTDVARRVSAAGQLPDGFDPGETWDTNPLVGAMVPSRKQCRSSPEIAVEPPRPRPIPACTAPKHLLSL